MGGVRFIARSQLHRRWPVFVLLAVVIGVVGGGSMALIAGARRSASVVDRYLSVARRYDVEVYDESSHVTQRDLLRIPVIRRADPGPYVGLMATTPDGTPRPGTNGINGMAFDWSAVDRTHRILSGSLPRPSRMHDVVVNETFARQFGARIGDRIYARAFGRDQGDEVSNGVYDPTGPRYRFRVAAIERSPSDIVLDERPSTGSGAYTYNDANIMLVANAFYEAHRHEFLDFGTDFHVQLRAVPHAKQRLRAALDALVSPSVPGGPLILPVEDQTHRSSLEAPVALESNALLALGIGLALAGGIVVVLMLRAEQRLHDDDTPTLRALGCSASRLGAVAVVRSLASIVTGMVLAVLVALALSPRFPIGIGRQVELSRGFDVNLAVVAIGASTMLLALVAVSFALGRPRAQSTDPPRRPSMANRLGRAGAPLDVVLGAYLAFTRQRRTRSVPARPALAGGAALLTIVVSLAIYAAGVDDAYQTARAHGFPWDAVIGNVNFPLSQSTVTAVEHDRRLTAVTKAKFGQVTVGGLSTEVLAFDPQGDAEPVVTAGRLPQRRDEIALGAELLDRIGAHVGSNVTFTVKNGEFDTGRTTHRLRMKVVGRALAPAFGEADVGNIGIVPLATVAAAGGDASPRLELVRFRDRDLARAVTALDRAYTEEIGTDVIPAQVVSLHRVRSVPLAGMLIASVLLLVLVTYVVSLTVRVRRHDLAVLRALGYRSRQLRGPLVWSSVLPVLGGLVVGVPAGLLLGSLLWDQVTDPIGIVYEASVGPRVLLVAALTVAIAVIVPLVLSRRIRHAQVADTLRVD